METTKPAKRNARRKHSGTEMSPPVKEINPMVPDDKSQQRVEKLFSELGKIARELEKMTRDPHTTGDKSGTENEKVPPVVQNVPAADEGMESGTQSSVTTSDEAIGVSRVEAPAEPEEQTRRTQAATVKFFSRILDNPIIAKELKGRMRGHRGFITIGFYISLISFFIMLIYLFIVADGGFSRNDPGLLQTIGKVIFSTVVLLELLMLGFIGPSLTAGAISSEREHQTIDLLRTSLLSAPALVFGKLSSAVVFLLLLIFTAIPVESLAFFMGGVGMAEMVVSTLMLVVSAIFFCTLGLFYSSFSKRTTVSNVLSYGTILFSFILFVILLFFIGVVSSSSQYYNSGFMKDMVNIAIWFLFSINPFFAAVVSEMILIENQSLFFTTNNLFGSSSLIPLPSPWIIYCVFHIFLTIILICFSIFFVSRPDK